jgi:hypothetical protein
LLADSQPDHYHPYIPDLLAEAYVTEPLPGKILEPVGTKSGLEEITVAECIAEDGKLRYRGNLYVLENDGHRQKCKSTIGCAMHTRAHAQRIASFPWTPARHAAYSHL